MATIDLKFSDRLILRRVCGCSNGTHADPDCFNCKGTGTVDQLITPEELYNESFGIWFQKQLTSNPRFRQQVKRLLGIE